MGKIWLSPSNGCWLDVWAAPRFGGRHVRLLGPIDLPHLRIGDDDDAGLHSLIGSLVVGPNAYVQCYDGDHFDCETSWLLPDQRVDDVANLPCGDEIDCLRIWDRPPFANERGYAAYTIRAAAQRSDPPE